jgi:rubrerythrin
MKLELLTELIRRISPDMEHELVATAIIGMDDMKRRVRELDAMLEGLLIEWIDANGDIEIGGVRYYVGKASRVKCRDVKATLDRLLTEFGGDLDRVSICLSSSAWKHGQVRREAGEQTYEQLFETTVAPELATGKPRREIKKSNPMNPSKETDANE